MDNAKISSSLLCPSKYNFFYVDKKVRIRYALTYKSNNKCIYWQNENACGQQYFNRQKYRDVGVSFIHRKK